MFKTILFATSGTPACDDAARTAFEMASRYQAKIIVFHVLGVPTRAYSQIVKDVRTGDEVQVDEDYVEWVREELKNTYTHQLSRCKDFEIQVVVGLPHREILRAARKVDADAIVMGASARDADGARYYRRGTGSTMQLVAKAARCPVLTVHRPSASYWGGISSIVYGTDFSKPADYAFSFAKNLVKELDCELHLFHALDISAMHAGKVLDQDAIEDNILEARNRIRGRYVAQLDPDFKEWEIEVWEGVPYVEIVKYAREVAADLIVMAHHARDVTPEESGIGSTLEQVILRANCPVVSVNHPDKVE